MALEERIVAWSKERPNWQRKIMRRAAMGELLSDADYDRLIDDIVATDTGPAATFGLEHFPKTGTDDPPVRLLSIAKIEHVNALASEQPLTFQPEGLTIVYGDNASGKSGYARLLKRIARVRHQEEVLSDVFRDTATEKPTAALSVRIGDRDEKIAWPVPSRSELQRMLFYDGACREAYIATESSFPYRPSALIVMDGLIKACVEIRSRIDERLSKNGRSAVRVPAPSEEAKHTKAAQFLDRLSGKTTTDSLDEFISPLDEAQPSLDELKHEEARLRSTDRTKERLDLKRRLEKLSALHAHIQKLHEALSDDALEALHDKRDQLKALQDAADLVARRFESEPVIGVGSSPWAVLWQAARRFSEAKSYPERRFPVVDPGSRCVLCHQTLNSAARDRLSSFEALVQADAQTQLNQARTAYDSRVETLKNLVITPGAVAGNLRDLEPAHAELINDYTSFLDRYEGARNQLLDCLAGTRRPLFGIQPAEFLAQLSQVETRTQELAEALEDPGAFAQRLAIVTPKRLELELLLQIKRSREAIVGEIERLREREALEAAKAAAATGPITKKILEFSDESITDVVRDAFTREADRLQLERVTIARTRAQKGALLHQPKLVGARQAVELPQVFSEGERTALGLAAFFTEAQIDGSRSALILDDPVNSLDHIRRRHVAARLAALAANRQVILFTHDVAFVDDLKREARSQGTSVAERSVTRSRTDERKPGACSATHPWKAKDVAARIDTLRTGLARIKRKGAVQDERTYEDAVALWAGDLSETWERIFSQEIVGPILAEGGLEVRPMMVKVLARFSDDDDREFQASYSRISRWVRRHDKSPLVNYVPPAITELENELKNVDTWFRRVRGYKNK